MRLDKYETLEALEDALYSIGDAMDALRPVEDDGGVFDTLSDLQIVVQTMRDELHAEICAAEQAEEREEIAAYHREVL